MDIEKVNMLRLNVWEVINFSSVYEAFLVAYKLTKLGFYLDNGDNYYTLLSKVENDVDAYVVDPHAGLILKKGTTTGKAVHTAVEWLNRHNTFVVGQPVLVGDDEKDVMTCPELWRYLSHNVCVPFSAEFYGKDEDELEDYKFRPEPFGFIRSSYPRWEDIE